MSFKKICFFIFLDFVLKFFQFFSVNQKLNILKKIEHKDTIFEKS
ncbi:hypothetical protein TGUWTKB_6300 [Candidatus Tachikawaea gelatinosa]|uniref:Uncharacterized protein n=1 Tax=Candidatus Tachikawaea gelatinosa TaxID=1410383 RepID=A0A090AR57_9ENTR|nr:hypothetical protein TGUWTKB_6300 [Candidatus Tachikawaea gelatinosa]